MNEQKKLVPKLRFPEFRGAEGWRQRQLAEITTAIFDGTHQTPTYTDKGVPFYSVENLVSGNANKFISRPDYEVATKKNKPEKGDVLITRIGKIGYSQVVTWSHDFSIYVTLAVIKKDGRFNSDFLNQFIQSAFYQKEILSKSLLNAVPCKINMDSLRATHVLLASPAEQQKIADCLSSLDELIAAQARKVEALKTHKKGLMQQLVPREGETQPRLQFPEFQGKAAWMIWPGDKLFEQISDKNPTPGLPVLAITQEHGAIPRSMIDYHVSVTDKSIESYKVVQVGDFIISLRSFQGGIEYSQYLGICSPAYVVLRRRVEGSDTYFKHYLKTDRFIQILTKNLEGLRDGKMISYKQFCELQIPIASPNEQKKIAECLSSLDNLVTTATQELEFLKIHKSGLMQLLFPSLEVLKA